MSIKPGTTIDDRYLVAGVLGSGGMGDVLLCEEIALQRKVAVKVIQRSIVAESDSLARFQREAQVLSQLSHKNLVGFYRYGLWHNRPYMVMEFIDGNSLERLLKNGPLPAREAVSVLMQLSQALRVIHDCGIIHRDLKASNIMIDRENTVKVLDFGLCGILENQDLQHLTESGFLIGSVAYMSPEVCSGKKASNKSDIYACGILFYQMLTGSLPFNDDSPIGILYKHANAEIPRLSDNFPLLPVKRKVDGFLQKCLAKNPEERFSRAQDLFEALKDLERELPEIGEISPFQKANSRQSRSSRKLYANLAIGGLLLIFICLLNPSSFASATAAFADLSCGKESDRFMIRAASLASQAHFRNYAKALLTLALSRSDKKGDVLMQALLEINLAALNLQEDKNLAQAQTIEALNFLQKNQDKLEGIRNPQKIDKFAVATFGEIIDTALGVLDKTGQKWTTEMDRKAAKLDGTFSEINYKALTRLHKFRLKHSMERWQRVLALEGLSSNFEKFDINQSLKYRQQAITELTSMINSGTVQMALYEREQIKDHLLSSVAGNHLSYAKTCIKAMLESPSALSPAKDGLRHCDNAINSIARLRIEDEKQRLDRLFELDDAYLAQAKLHLFLSQTGGAKKALNWHKKNREALAAEENTENQHIQGFSNFVNDFARKKIARSTQAPATRLAERESDWLKIQEALQQGNISRPRH